MTFKTDIAFGADHRGYRLKNQLLQEFGGIDCGTDAEASTDASDYALKVVEQISLGQAERGILICGSGVMMCLAANRFPYIRAALCHTAEAARAARAHNDVNILCLAADTLDDQRAREIVTAFLETAASSEERFVRRRDKLDRLDPKMFDKES